MNLVRLDDRCTTWGYAAALLLAATTACRTSSQGSPPPAALTSAPPRAIPAAPKASLRAHREGADASALRSGVPSATADPSAASIVSGARSQAAAPPWRPDPERYPWLGDGTKLATAPVEPLSARFAPPTGYERIARDPTSFGGWLAELPLAAPGTPVVTYSGATAYPAADRRIAAVAALDVGGADLQQCADTVIRLHAEWTWARGRRDQSYQAAGGLALPYRRFSRGERLVYENSKLGWRPVGRATTDHVGFRQYLAQVFGWANTVSLAQQARPVPISDVRAGDFFVMPGNPGHTVLVLDIATDPAGRQVALIGQSYMPAQSFYVLRGPRGAWFDLDPTQPLDTPFWQPFPWETLHRLD